MAAGDAAGATRDALAEARRAHAEDLGRRLLTLRGMLSRGELTVRRYNGCMVGLAAEYAVLGMAEDALHLAGSTPAAYYREDLEEDAAQDPLLADAACKLAEWLMHRGHVDGAGAEPLMPGTSMGAA